MLNSFSYLHLVDWKHVVLRVIPWILSTSDSKSKYHLPSLIHLLPNVPRNFIRQKCVEMLQTTDFAEAFVACLVFSCEKMRCKKPIFTFENENTRDTYITLRIFYLQCSRCDFLFSLNFFFFFLSYYSSYLLLYSLISVELN